MSARGIQTAGENLETRRMGRGRTQKSRRRTHLPRLERLEDRTLAFAGFSSPVSYGAGANPAYVAIGDLNADGKPDLVGANYAADSVSVLLGIGNGTFQTKTDFTTGSGPRGIAIAELNMDGKLDLVTANSLANTISVLLGNGDGTFQSKTDYTTGASPWAVAVGDFNKDGKLGIVTANFLDSTVSWFKGNGDGTFQPKADHATGTGPRAIAVGDVHPRDGNPDFVTANYLANSVSVVVGNGNGTFQPKTDYATGNGPVSVAVGDVARNARLDIVTANFDANTISVLLAKGNGTFHNKADYNTGAGPSAVALSDLDRDGKLDVVTANSAANTVSVLINSNNGTFQPKLDYATGMQPAAVAVDDLNNDGFPDAVTADYAANTLSVLLNQTQVNATHFSVVGPANVTAGASFTFTVTALTALNTIATGYTGTVHFTSNGGQATLPVDYTFTLADAGVKTFNATLKTAGSQSLTATDTVDGTITGTQSGITVTAAAATSMIVAGFPSPTTAGQNQTFTVTVQDAYGNTATGYTGAVHFTSNDGQATLPVDYTFTLADAGVKTFNATLKTAGSQSLTATDTVDGTITGTQSGITVTAAAATSMIVAGFPSPTTAGQNQTFTVTVQDAYGNTATGYTGTVHFTSNDGQATLPADYTFTVADAGVKTFNATLKTAGSQSLTATDTVDGTITGTQSGITVTSAAATSMIVAGFPSPTTAGQDQTFTVTVQDAYGNTATGYTGAVHFTSNDGQATLPVDYTFTLADAGVKTFNATLKTAGSRSLTATDTVDGTITGTQSGITVTAAAATSVIVAGFPSPTTAGQNQTFTVTVQDAYGNTATGYTGAVHFTSNDGQATLPVDYTFTLADAGVKTFNATLKTAGSRLLTATDTVDGTITGTQSGITVTAAVATSMIVAGFPSPTTAGQNQTFTVTVQDAYGNTATGYTGAVHFTSNDGQATLPADYTFTLADAGVKTFNATLKTAGSRLLTATDTVDGTITGTQSGITVTSAAATSMIVAGFPSPTTAGQNQTFTVTVQDAYGNTATGYTGAVHFTSNDGQATLPADYTFTLADAGVKTFNATLKTAGSRLLTATDTVDGTITGTQSGITVTSAAATSMIVAGFPSPTTAGQDQTFTVTVQDAYGNTATGYTGAVHFTSNDGQATLPVDYTFTLADAGVKTFNATLKTAGSRSLTATDTVDGTITGTQSGITVTAAAVSVVLVSGFPSPVTPGVAGNVTVTVRDAYGNVVTNYSGTVTITSTDGQATLPPPDSPLTNGVGIFSVTLNTPGFQGIIATESSAGLSGNQNGIVVKASSSATLTGWVYVVKLGRPVTFTSTVTGSAPGFPAPSGTVQFLDNGVPIGSAVVLVNGKAVFSTSSLTLGLHTITARYDGDGFYQLSTSSPALQAVHNAAFFGLGGSNGRVQVRRTSNNSKVAEFAPYGSAYTAGVALAFGDINGDGYDEVVTGPSAGNPHVKVYDGKDFADGSFNPANPDASLLASWFAYALQFNVGANLAIGDVNHDGYGDVVTGATAGNPHVKVYDGKAIANGTFNPANSLLAQWFPYALQFNVGANVGAGDVNADGFGDVITGATVGNPHVRVQNGLAIANGSFNPANPTASELAQWFPYALQFNVGAFVTAGDVNGDGYYDVITGSSIGNPDVRAYSGKAIANGTFNPANPGGSLLTQFFAFGVGQNIGVAVGASDFESNGKFDILTGATRGAAAYRVIRGNASGVQPPALFEGTLAGFPEGLRVGA